jgi:uncharacterized membrane protein YgdD (TMEM256/DUF423 family)
LFTTGIAIVLGVAFIAGWAAFAWGAWRSLER